MPKFWASWWSGNYAVEGCSAPPFKFWVSGERDRCVEGTDLSICAHVESESEEALRATVAQHFPGAEWRFCNPVADDWTPGDRFPPHEEG